MTIRPEQTPAADPDSPVEEDVVVVGGGAAGLSAAVFLARYGLETTAFARGKSAIHQCAHLENYLGFPGGITPTRFLALGRTQAEHEGATVVSDRVETVTEVASGFRVETQDDRAVRSRYVVAASAYDDEYLDGFAAALETDADDAFVTDQGRTPVEGLYATGWLTSDTAHQAIVNAGDGARVALALIRDDVSERYWPAVGDLYVDWVVDDGLYGGDEWEEQIDEWFEGEIRPGADERIPSERIEEAREDLKGEFLRRGIEESDRQRRERAGQRRLLEQLDDDVVREYAEGLDEN